MKFTYPFWLLSCLLLLFCSFVSAAADDVDTSSLDLGLDLLLLRRSDSPSLVNDAEFKSAMISGHNWYRNQHNAAGLRWDGLLAAASKVHSSMCKFTHSGTPVGENVASNFKSVAAVVNAWGGERTLYDYSHPGFSLYTGHFTQMVWKNTNSVGCGRSLCSGIGWFVVCQYAPPGNFIGAASFMANVGVQIQGIPTDKWSGQVITPSGRSLGTRNVNSTMNSGTTNGAYRYGGTATLSIALTGLYGLVGMLN